MTVFQILSVCFALFMLYVIRVKGKRYALTKLESLFWSALWITFGILALFPNTLLGVSHSLKFSRVFDLLTVGAMSIMCSIIVFQYFAVRGIQQKLEKLVREEAIHTNIKRNKIINKRIV